MKKLFLVLLFSTFMLTAWAQVKRVAITDPLDKEGALDYGKKLLLRSCLTTAVNMTEGYEAYDRVDFKENASAEADFQRDGGLSDTMIQYIGRTTGAQLILVSEVAAFDFSNIIISSKIIDVTSSRITNSDVQVCSTEPRQMQETCYAHAAKLLGSYSVAQAASNGRTSAAAPAATKTNYKETAYGINMSMIYVKGGEFMMGGTSEQGSAAESDETVIRRVNVNDFYIGQFEVTQAQWEAVMGTSIYQQKSAAGGSGMAGVGPDYPMYYVSWEEASEFCRILSRKTGKKYSLPTEAEWEYAARGGQKSDKTKFSGSNLVSYVAWYDDNSNSSTHPVGSKNSNELDIYDMSGNVWEWCYDWYSNSYSRGDVDNPTGPASGSSRVLCGGSWCSNASYCRVSYRNCSSPGNRFSNLGFRVVRRP